MGRTGNGDQLESLGTELSERGWDVLLAVRMEKMKEFRTQAWTGNKEGVKERKTKVPANHMASAEGWMRLRLRWKNGRGKLRALVSKVFMGDD